MFLVPKPQLGNYRRVGGGDAVAHLLAQRRRTLQTGVVPDGVGCRKHSKQRFASVQLPAFRSRQRENCRREKQEKREETAVQNGTYLCPILSARLFPGMYLDSTHNAKSRHSDTVDFLVTGIGKVSELEKGVDARAGPSRGAVPNPIRTAANSLFRTGAGSEEPSAERGAVLDCATLLGVIERVLRDEIAEGIFGPVKRRVAHRQLAMCGDGQATHPRSL